MVHTSVYAFPGVYEGRKKSTPLVSVESWGGGPPPPPPPIGQCPQINCFPSVMASPSQHCRLTECELAVATPYTLKGPCSKKNTFWLIV